MHLTIRWANSTVADIQAAGIWLRSNLIPHTDDRSPCQPWTSFHCLALPDSSYIAIGNAIRNEIRHNINYLEMFWIQFCNYFGKSFDTQCPKTITFPQRRWCTIIVNSVFGTRGRSTLSYWIEETTAELGNLAFNAIPPSDVQSSVLVNWNPFSGSRLSTNASPIILYLTNSLANSLFHSNYFINWNDNLARRDYGLVLAEARPTFFGPSWTLLGRGEWRFGGRK